MPRGKKSSSTAKQKRQTRQSEKGYEKKGSWIIRAKQFGWAAVNKLTGGGHKSGSGKR